MAHISNEKINIHITLFPVDFIHTSPAFPLASLFSSNPGPHTALSLHVSPSHSVSSLCLLFITWALWKNTGHTLQKVSHLGFDVCFLLTSLGLWIQGRLLRKWSVLTSLHWWVHNIKMTYKVKVVNARFPNPTPFIRSEPLRPAYR